jgi:hypothetical protein
MIKRQNATLYRNSPKNRKKSKPTFNRETEPPPSNPTWFERIEHALHWEASW